MSVFIDPTSKDNQLSIAQLLSPDQPPLIYDENMYQSRPNNEMGSPMTPEGFQNGSPPNMSSMNNSKKRPSSDSNAKDSSKPSAFPRKRSITACEFCRFKKVKCDNNYPNCSSCQKAGIKCSLTKLAADPESNKSYSVFDHGTLTILKRIDALEDKLNMFSRSPAATSPSKVSKTEAATESSNGQAELEKVEGNTYTAEASNWKFMQRKFKDLNISPDFNLMKHLDRTAKYPQWDMEQSSHLNAPIDPIEISYLIEKFLNRVHTKNPILNPLELRSYLEGHLVEENMSFFRQNDKSCLVAICCALGAVSTSLAESEALLLENSIDQLSTTDLNYILATKYYAIALSIKPFLNPSSLISLQCYVFLGIYHMYLVDPVSAYHEFNYAYVSCMMLIKSGKYDGINIDTLETLHDDYNNNNFNSNDGINMVERLYWTCLRSETELKESLSLNEITGISRSRFVYPVTLPKPPISSANDDLSIISWYYYLTEIAVYKITNDILFEMYKEINWNKIEIVQLINIKEKYLSKVEEIYDKIEPVLFKLQSTNHEPIEIVEQLRGRFYWLKFLIYRPLIYKILNNIDSDEIAMHEGVINEQISRYLEIHDDIYKLGATYKHRHHGIWLHVKEHFNYGLIICGLYYARGEAFVKFEDLQKFFGKIVSTLSYWRKECPEFNEMIATLNMFLHDIKENRQSKSF